jgi:hypothetical protein
MAIITLEKERGIEMLCCSYSSIIPSPFFDLVNKTVFYNTKIIEKY